MVAVQVRDYKTAGSLKGEVTVGKSRVSIETPLILESLSRTEINPDLLTHGLQPRLEQVVNAMEEFLTEVDEARRSNRYTEAGLREFGAKAATEARKKLALVRQDVQKYHARVQELTSQARAKITKKEDSAANSVRQWELRSLMRGLDQLRRDFLYKEALRAGDVELLDAIESAPRAFPLVDAKLIEESQGARLKAVAPDTWKDIEDLSAIARSLEGTLSTAEQELSKSGHPPEGGIRIMNGGASQQDVR
jgi:hypothetical protein